MAASEAVPSCVHASEPMSAYKAVWSRVAAAAAGVHRTVIGGACASAAGAASAGAAVAPALGSTVRLVAVSKTKSVEEVGRVYDEGHRHFGENYVQELVGKAATMTQPDIAWHFIGNLQRNKVAMLVQGVPTLWAVESVDSTRLATALNKAVGDATAAGKRPATPLRVFVQVNTSEEEQKGGAGMGDDTLALARTIVDACPHLQLVGLMTIGKEGEPGTLYFQRLREQRDAVAAALCMPSAHLELSMGMSADFEEAIAAGATNVRVGSSIFGARAYPPRRSSATAAGAADGVPSASASGAGPLPAAP